MRFARKTGSPFNRRPARQREEGDEGVIPLINIVFLLLIFFMLAGKLTQADPFQVTPPPSASTDLPEAVPNTILVGADGQLAFAGKPVELEALAEVLAGEVKTQQPMAEDAPPLRLKADQEADAGRVIQVMETLRAAGVEKLLLLTSVRESGS
ncbi:ExbD/TolR family protein [Oceanibaculum pacificum]|uniref:Biopolymer transporter ExbD n=1 Tax=Oceanibaculum pacificum TaxID=580166 RepID=A0A154VUC0_9PROT|nr:biopolymer transporter ExbD [Oceanibaculum pacificum]KZD04865.1 biopolymer transporter ExbD [Oceanibaculum pacificum]